MESEEDCKLPFFERERVVVCLLPLCTENLHTLPHFKSHHPNHVKRGIVRCLDQRARRVTNMSENLKEEENWYSNKRNTYT